MAAKDTGVTRQLRESDGPPPIAEQLLHILLPPAHRETMSGDLLEAYRDEIVPTRGTAGARRWYLRQAASLVVHVNPPAQWAIWVAGATALIVAFLLRHNVAPPAPAAAWTSLAVLGVAALSTRLPDVGTLSRVGLAHGALLVGVVVAASTTVVRPAPESLFVGAFTVVFVSAGVGGSWRSHRIGPGVLAAALTGVVGALLWRVLASTVLPDLLVPGGSHTFTLAFMLLGSINHPLMLVMLGLVPGAIGAIAGTAVGRLVASRTRRRRSLR